MIEPNESRVPVVFASAAIARPGDAILADHNILHAPGAVLLTPGAKTMLSGHSAGCACCARSAIARVLAAAYVTRIRAGAPRFLRLVVDLDAEGQAAVRAAIAADAFVAGRYVLA